jgi:adenylate cyclase, class 2
MQNREIEARFLEINKDDLVKKLRALGANDLGEILLREIIFYDRALAWRKDGQFIRLREAGGKVTLAYKHHKHRTVDGTTEIELTVNDAEKAEAFLEIAGFVAYRHQEKRRHTFQLGDITIDIDTWPRVPTYVELEGSSEEVLKELAKKLDLDWNGAAFGAAGTIIENRYHIPVHDMRWFTFDKFE